MGILWKAASTERLNSSTVSSSNLNLGILVLVEGRKPKVPGEKPLVQRQEPTANSIGKTHMSSTFLHHPCSPRAHREKCYSEEHVWLLLGNSDFLFSFLFLMPVALHVTEKSTSVCQAKTQHQISFSCTIYRHSNTGSLHDVVMWI